MVLLLVSALAAALFANGVAGKIASATSTAVCRVIGGNCAPGEQSKAPPNAGATPGASSSNGGKTNTVGKANTVGKKESSGKGWCSSNWLTTGLCIVGEPFVNAGKAVWGVALGAWDTVVGLWDTVTFVGCLVHICSQSGFASNWGAVGNLFAHPDKAFPAIWSDMTKHCHEWETTAVTRCATDFIGSFLGAKGLNKLKSLGVLNKIKDAKAAKAEKAAKAAKAVQRAALLARIQKLVDETGKPTKAFVIGADRITVELPYRLPPGIVKATVDHPLDLAALKPEKYLWIVDDKGAIRLALEESPSYYSHYGKRYWIKHGDLAADGGPGTPLASGDGVVRPSARAGGELKPQMVDGKPTGRWILDNSSSYSFEHTRGDGIALKTENLQAVKDLLQAMGTDTSKVDISNVIH